MEDYVLWYKSIHVISVISWMAAMLYMPRLFMYHTKAKTDSEMDKTFQIMERRLLRFIMNPAMIATYIFGLLTTYIYGFLSLGMWFHLKMCAVLFLTVFHMFLARLRKDFEKGKNTHSENFYKVINEIPTVLMIISVVLVIVKPFE